MLTRLIRICTTHMVALMDAANAMHALEQTRKRLETLYREAVRGRVERGLFEDEIGRRVYAAEERQLEEEITAIDWTLDRLRAMP